MKLQAGETIYYEDEFTDDFLETKTNRDVCIDAKYKYLSKNVFFRLFSFLVYYLIAIPFLWLYGKLVLKIRVEGRENLKTLKKTGYVIYGNHTNWWDAYIGPVFIARPKRAYIVASKKSVSIRGLSTIVRSVGCLPLPETTQAFVNFNRAVHELMDKKKALVVFPEAHIWPYYTGVRPFSAVSFKYAVNSGVPAVPIAVTYRAPRKGKKSAKKPHPTIHIGAPIYPELTLSKKEAAEKLRDGVYDYMVKTTAGEDNYAYCSYVKKEKI